MIDTILQNRQAADGTWRGKFLLPKNVFVCFRDEQAVILDLRSDRYLAVDPRGARALRSLYPDCECSDGARQSRSEDFQHILETMEAGGMLTRNPHEGVIAGPLTVPAPVLTLARNWSLEGASPLRGRKIRMAHLLAFICAVTKARWSLRVRKLQSVVSRVAAQRADREVISDRAAIAALIDVFNSLRPFLLTAADECLLNSLALLNFLRWFHIHPSWIFGVRHVPFAAHCWLQQDDMLLDNHVDYAQLFTPIMVV